MRRIALAIAFLAGLIAPAFCQKAEIDAVNAKWIELFNKGDFAGIASLYTDDATALPPGSAMVKGSAAIGAMWKGMAEQVGDPKLTTLEVKPLSASAAREIGTFSLKTKGPAPQEVTGKYRRLEATGSSRPISGTTANRPRPTAATPRDRAASRETRTPCARHATGSRAAATGGSSGRHARAPSP